MTQDDIAGRYERPQLAERRLTREEMTQRGLGIAAMQARIAELWGEGRSDDEIGEAIDKCAHTVKRYRQVLQLINPVERRQRRQRGGAGISGRWSNL